MRSGKAPAQLVGERSIGHGSESATAAERRLDQTLALPASPADVVGVLQMPPEERRCVRERGGQLANAARAGHVARTR